jgi:hypothetical protein
MQTSSGERREADGAWSMLCEALGLASLLGIAIGSQPVTKRLYYYSLLKVFNAKTLRTLLSSSNDLFDSILLNVQVLANLVSQYDMLC